MMTATAHAPDQPATVGYETPPPSQSAERCGPYHLVRDDRGGVRITGVYRRVWGQWGAALYVVATVGIALLICGAVVDGVPGRTVVIDLRQFPPVLRGSAVTLLGIGMLAFTALCWLAFPALTWRRFHRLEIDAGREELIVRQLLPAGGQIAGRWKSADVERVVAAQYELTVQPRDGAPATFALGGPWTAAFWLEGHISAAMGITGAAQRTKAAG